jgi:hypothetical protein
MPALGQNPVLTPLRRWVLYSRTNLALSVVGVFVLLFGLGQVFGSPASTDSVAATGDIASTSAAGSTAAVSTSPRAFDTDDEVSEFDVAAMSPADVAASPQATAMKYAYVYTDSAASETAWSSGLAMLAPDGALTQDFRDARPSGPVTITGPTQTTSAIVGGEDAATVTVPTTAGPLKVHLAARTEAGTRSWLVATPLPSLDTGTGAGAPSTTTTAAPSTSAAPTTSTTTPAATSAAPAPAPSTPAPTTALAPSPAPAPGPIPIPDLDTPLPGAV